MTRNSQGRNRKTGVSSIMDLIGRFNKLDKAAGNEVARNKGRNMKGEAEGEEDKLTETAMKPLAQGETARNQVSVMPLTLSREAARNEMVEAARNLGRNKRPLETPVRGPLRWPGTWWRQLVVRIGTWRRCLIELEIQGEAQSRQQKSRAGT